MCIKKYLIVLIPIFDTMYKGKKQVKIYMWALHQELVLFLQIMNCFRYVPDNDIEGDILGWTTSKESCGWGGEMKSQKHSEWNYNN